MTLLEYMDMRVAWCVCTAPGVVGKDKVSKQNIQEKYLLNPHHDKQHNNGSSITVQFNSAIELLTLSISHDKGQVLKDNADKQCR